MISGDACSNGKTVYLVLRRSTSARHALDVWQLWQSLPLAAKLLAVFVLAEAGLWLASIASATSPLTLRPLSNRPSFNLHSHQDSWVYGVLDCHRNHAGCSLDQWQVTVTTLVAQLLYSYLTLDALYDENSSQLLASTGFSIVTGFLWLVYVAGLRLPSLAWRLGLSLGFVLITVTNIWLAYLTHQQFGWRVHSKLPCDYRRKYALEKRQLYMYVNRFRTVLKVSIHSVIINTVNGLAVALTTRHAARTGAAVTSASGAPGLPSTTSSTSGPAIAGLLVSAGLSGLPLLWLLVTYLAVMFKGRKLEMLSTVAMPLLLLLPALPIYWVFSPAYAWPERAAVQVLLIVVPQALWMVLHVATWCSMRQLLSAFRSPDIAEIVSATVDGVSLDQDVPEQLQPLLKGAWLKKLREPITSRTGNSHSNSKSVQQSVSDKFHQQHCRVSTSGWLIPTATSPIEEADSKHNHCGLLQTWARRLSSLPNIVVSMLSCNSTHWRFFQLSIDFTMLRWSWNKYIILYYVESLTVDADRLTITLHLALDPDLTLSFEDPRMFDQWESALQLLLHMLTGAAPGSIRAGVCPAQQGVTAANKLLEHGKSLAAGLPGVESHSSRSTPIADPNPGNGSHNPYSAAVVPGPGSAIAISQHSLVEKALNVASAHHGKSIRRVSHTGPESKGRSSAGSILRGSRRGSVLDPHAVKLQQAQAMVDIVTRQLSSATALPPPPAAHISTVPQEVLGQLRPHEQSLVGPWLQPEHKAWLQQGSESDAEPLPAAVGAAASAMCSLGRGAVAAAAAISTAAEGAGAGQLGAAADELARQLHLPPHQVLSHLQQEPGTDQHGCAVDEAMPMRGGPWPTETIQVGQPEGLVPKRCTPAYAISTGMGPFRTPAGLLKHMQLGEQHTNSWKQLSSEEGSSAAAGPSPGIVSSSSSGYTADSTATATPDRHQLRCQGSFSLGSDPWHGPSGTAADAGRCNSPSRLQQHSIVLAGQPRSGQQQPSDHQLQQQQQDYMYSQVLQVSPMQPGLLNSSDVTGRASPAPGQQPQSTLMHEACPSTDSAAGMLLPPAGYLRGQQDSRQQPRGSTESWGPHTAEGQQTLRQFYEQQYSQPPTPNIAGVYTSAALTRSGESPVVPVEAAGSVHMLRANSMPAALQRWTSKPGLHAGHAEAYSHSSDWHTTASGSQLQRQEPELHAAHGGRRAAFVDAQSAGKADMLLPLASQGLHTLRPLGDSKAAVPGGSFVPPLLGYEPSSLEAIPAVWSFAHQQKADAGNTVLLSAERQQQAPEAEQPGQPLAAEQYDLSSTRASAGGSLQCLQSPAGKLQGLPKMAAMLLNPAYHQEHLHLPGTSGQTTTAAALMSSSAAVSFAQQPCTRAQQHAACIASALPRQEPLGQQAAAGGDVVEDQLVAFCSNNGTVGSSSTSRAASLVVAGLPPFSVVMAQIEGGDVEAYRHVQQTNYPIPGSAPVSAGNSIEQPADTAVQLIETLTGGPRAAGTGNPPQNKKQVAIEPKAEHRNSGSGGSIWRGSLHSIVATIVHAVSGGGAASPCTRQNLSSTTAAEHSSVLDKPAAPIVSRRGLSPFSTATPFAAATGGPGIRSPSRSPSVAANRRGRTSDRTGATVTATGRTSGNRRCSFAEASFRASSVDSVLPSTRGPSRTSFGNLTVYGWSDWGRSTITDIETPTESESVLNSADDSFLVNVPAAGASAAVPHDLAAPLSPNRHLDFSCSEARVRPVASGSSQHQRVAARADIAASSSNSSSQSSSDDTDTVESAGQQVAAQAAALQPSVHVSAGSGTVSWPGRQSQPQLIVKPGSTACVTCGSSQQPHMQSGGALSSSARIHPTSCGSTSAELGRSHSTGHIGLRRIPSAQYGSMPQLPVLPEAPASAELDNTDATDSLDDQQQRQLPLAGITGDNGSRQLGSGEAVLGPQQQQQQQECLSSDEQDDPSLRSFIFDASAQAQQQPITLQAAYQHMQLARSQAAPAGPAEPILLLRPCQHQQQGQSFPRGPCSPRCGCSQTAEQRVNSNGNSTRTDSTRPAALRVSLSDAAVTAAGTACFTEGLATAPPLSPRVMSSGSLGSPTGCSRLQVRVPYGRRSSAQGHGSAAHPYSPSALHQGSPGLAQPSNQLVQHGDGYTVNSPGSLVSFNSHVSAFADASPRLGRACRQSATSAGYGGSLRLADSLSVTYSGWSTHSACSDRSASSFRRGVAPQVSVEVVDWRSLQLGRKIGHGAEGCVYEARYQDAPVAVKEGPGMSEIDIYLAAGSHDNLVGLRGLCQKEDGTWCLLLEYCGRGTLDTLLHHSRSPLPRPAHHHRTSTSGRHSNNGAKTHATDGAIASHQQQLHPSGRPDLIKLLPFMRGIARGLLHLHTRRPAILHRDIKPANIFIGHGMVMKIGDFGMSRHVLPPVNNTAGSAAAAAASRRGSTVASGSGNGCSHSSIGGIRHGSSNGAPGHSMQHGLHMQSSTGGAPNRTLTPGVVGTICYTAPEVLDEQLQVPNASVDHILKADVYSLGVTFWEMVERRRPFEGMDGMQVCALWIADPERMVLPPLTVADSASECDKQVLAALQELVKECTAFNPDHRPTVSQVLVRIRHIQRLFDPKNAAANSVQYSKLGAETEGISAAAAQAGAEVSSNSAARGMHEECKPCSAAGGQHSLQTVAASKSLGEWLAAACLQPGVTEPTVAAAIAAVQAASGLPVVSIVSSHADTEGHRSQQHEDCKEMANAATLHGSYVGPHGPGLASVHRHSRSDGCVEKMGTLIEMSGEPGAAEMSVGLLHSRSLPGVSGQVTVLPRIQHSTLQCERRISGAGMHHRHVN